MARGNGSGRAVIEALIRAQAEMLRAIHEVAAATKVTAQKTGKLEKTATRMARTLVALGDLLQDHERRLDALETR
jgi:hypothetical protein